jgi:hypothetical protein
VGRSVKPQNLATFDINKKKRDNGGSKAKKPWRTAPMKKAPYLFFMSILVCISLACNLAEAAPIVEAPLSEGLPPADVQPPVEEQAPVNQPPAVEQPPAGEAPAGNTGSTQITSVSAIPPTDRSGMVSAIVSFVVQGTGDGINCSVDTITGPLHVFADSPDTMAGLTSETFRFYFADPGPHTLTCANNSSTSQQSAAFINYTPYTDTPKIINPGFENGFAPWYELPAALDYGGQSVDDNTFRYSGDHSRKLFLRHGGSYVIQKVPVNPALPAGTIITLSTYIRMPFAGSSSNKVFTLEMVVGDDSGQTQSIQLDQVESLPDWTPFEISLEKTNFEVTWIEVHVMTNKGDGTYYEFDKPVYVDDFYLNIILP